MIERGIVNDLSITIYIGPSPSFNFDKSVFKTYVHDSIALSDCIKERIQCCVNCKRSYRVLLIISTLYHKNAGLLREPSLYQVAFFDSLYKETGAL
jgi:hypothetical protein